MNELEQKVPAGGLGAFLGLETGDLLIYLASIIFYGGGDVPQEVAGFIASAAVVGLTVLGAWLAPHTPRPDLFAEIDG